jgi:hypothetical protein
LLYVLLVSEKVVFFGHQIPQEKSLRVIYCEFILSLSLTLSLSLSLSRSLEAVCYTCFWYLRKLFFGHQTPQEKSLRVIYSEFILSHFLSLSVALSLSLSLSLSLGNGNVFYAALEIQSVREPYVVSIEAVCYTCFWYLSNKLYFLWTPNTTKKNSRVIYGKFTLSLTLSRSLSLSLSRSLSVTLSLPPLSEMETSFMPR